jgi:hypothetical protein
MQQTTFEEALKNIGEKVTKTAFNRQKGNNIMPKPFKSGNLINTVKGVIMHPTLNIPAYTFEEDSTYVECRRCDVINDEFKQTKVWQEINEKLNSNVTNVLGDIHIMTMISDTMPLHGEEFKGILADFTERGVARPDGEF